jgi:hypothetical protein
MSCGAPSRRIDAKGLSSVPELFSLVNRLVISSSSMGYIFVANRCSFIKFKSPDRSSDLSVVFFHLMFRCGENVLLTSDNLFLYILYDTIHLPERRIPLLLK